LLLDAEMQNDVQTKDVSKENRAIYHVSVDTVPFVDTIVPFDNEEVGVDLVEWRVEGSDLARGEHGNDAE
jgi:hypothetical protein